MHHIYCISGLGADQRIFQKLEIENAQLHFIKWELPEASDNMNSYALRLAQQIKHEKIILLGVSYGGMLATEISGLFKQAQEKNAIMSSSVKIEKTILVSSCKSSKEFPGLMKFAGRYNLHKNMPYRLILRSNKLNRIVFDLQSKEEELFLKRVMLENSSLDFIKRSINIILKWKTDIAHHDLVHIHGTKDRLLSPGNVKADHWIKDGGHFMIWNKADEISFIINKVLQS